MYIVLAIIMFGLLIGLHELGHFMVAKACGVKVNEFAIGMGPTLLKKQGKETLYSLRLLPLGGYCAMEGENEDSGDSRGFLTKPAWQRALILAAGAAMNFLMGIAMVLCIAPDANFTEPIIAGFFEGCPYESADGLQVGDRIYTVDGRRTFFTTELSEAMYRTGSDTHRIVLIRDGKRVVLKDYPLKLVEYQLSDGSTVMKYGLYFAPRDFGLFANVRYAWLESLNFVRIVWDSLGDICRGLIGVRDLTGPVGIVDYVGEMTSEAESTDEAMFDVLYFFALIAVNLAVMNMLPIPALDGGRVFFLVVSWLIELVIRRKVSAKIEKVINAAGLVLLLGLMFFVMCNDIYKIIINR